MIKLATAKSVAAKKMFSSKKTTARRIAPLAHSHKVKGTSDRPRMSVCFTNENIYVQFIDDAAGAPWPASQREPKPFRTEAL